MVSDVEACNKVDPVDMSGVERKELLEVGTGENSADAGDEGVEARSSEAGPG